jgi:hypothetical protein
MRWRYSLHALEASGRLVLADRDPARALAAADDERAGARRHRVPKVEARALLLRGDALAMLERADEAEAALVEALRIADAIEHPRAAWRALGGLATLAHRAGRRADVERWATRRAALVVAAAQSLPAGDLRRELEAIASPEATWS